MPPKFFITHSWKDIDFASRLCDDLRAAGLDGFLDAHSIHPGESIPSRIEHGLKDCDVYLPVFSPDSLASDWCDWEVDMAITMNRTRKGRPRIIPVIVQPCDVPDRLMHLLYLNFVGRYDDALNELLTEGLGLPPKSPAAPVSPPVAEPKAPAAPVSPPLAVPKAPAVPVSPPQPEPKAPAMPLTPPLPMPKAPTTTKPRVNRVVLIVGALVAVMILIVGGIGVVRSGLFGPPTFGIGSTKQAADGAPMMFVPAGESLMGNDDPDSQAEEKPQHTVYLDAFWIDKYEVTNALYKKCVGARQCAMPKYWVNGAIPPGKEDHPVVGVGWADAVDYARWAGGRLPTEAEWEKAACWDEAKRVKHIFPWGDTFDQNLLNSVDGGKGDTTPVGSYPSGASPYGVLDMAGNVWEWTADWFDPGYYRSSPRDNPKGPASGSQRIMRGGSWVSSIVDARCVSRNRDNPVIRNDNTGFRVAESASP